MSVAAPAAPVLNSVVSQQTRDKPTDTVSGSPTRRSFSPLTPLSTSAVNSAVSQTDDCKPAMDARDDGGGPVRATPGNQARGQVGSDAPGAERYPGTGQDAPEDTERTPKRLRTPPDWDSSSTARPPTPRQGLSLLLGPGFSSWPYGETALNEALRLRAEQERTKQEYYRLENRRRALDLLNAAARAGVPGSAIAVLFGQSPQLYPQPKPGQSSAQASAPAPQPVQIPKAEPQNHPAPVVSPSTVRTPARVTVPLSNPGTPTSQQIAGQAAAVALHGNAPAKAPLSLATSPPQEVVHYEDQQQRSPVRFRPTHTRSASALPFATRPLQVYTYPNESQQQQQQQQTNSSRTSLQFHHWTPEQTQQPRGKPAGSPRREEELRLMSSQAEASPASVVAASNARRRSMHARHRSEVDVSKAPWYTRRSEEGASILVNMASERAKHEVGYILESRDESQGHSSRRPASDAKSDAKNTQASIHSRLPRGVPGPIEPHHGTN